MKQQPFVTIVLAGGRGTRMGSSDKHKVCFDVLGVPVIIRALETYNLCGAHMNVVVVGMMAESVMSTINRRFAGTIYAFQEQQRGTGDAARKGADILERMGFQGDVLIVAGDKVIEPSAVRQLLRAHQRSGADATLATARRPKGSSAGILLKASRGNIVGVLEELERQRVLGISLLRTAALEKPLTRKNAERLLGSHIGERALSRITKEVWPTGGTEALTSERLADLFSESERSGIVSVAGHQFPAATLLDQCDQMNLSTYLFRAPVLYDALCRLKPQRGSQEEYFTDVFQILAEGKKPARVVGSEILEPRALMAFNNPQELLAVEEVYRQKEGGTQAVFSEGSEKSLAKPERWTNLLQAPSSAARKQLTDCYGPEVPWAEFKLALNAFVERYGHERPVSIVRSPGRINLMGRHIDHQGGAVNVIAINREILLVAAPRADDIVTLANSDGTHFREQTFRISDLIANVNWDDWQNVIDGPRIQRLLDAARGDWANYVKAAILRLQDQFRDRQLRGLDMMVSGQIPMGAGLSSSSALVVATAEAVRTFNRLPVSARRLVSLCGEGEWFVGTRGGAADHAAIKLSRRGCVTRVGFFPFHIEDSAEFLEGYDLLICNSGIYAGKSSHARNTFNAKVTAYHIGRAWFKTLRPELAPLIEHLRDLTPQRLGLDKKTLAELLLQLPSKLTREQVIAAFGQFSEPDRATLQRLFASHDAPKGGYDVRGVVLFGLGEMARAHRCLDLLRSGNAAGLGRLMNVSHDGDRVATQTKSGVWRRMPLPGAGQSAAVPAPEALADMERVTGNYGCSLPELDRIVDIARNQPGVAGAQLAGAGLGGCVMVLAKKSAVDDLRQTLATKAIRAEVFRPIAGASILSLV